MKEIIVQKLKEIEETENVKILYACEAGSRAWGFESTDSDYDVRFVYVKPLEWYLSVDDKRDVLEFQINEQLDISGWDLKKTLQLMKRSNPPLIEWLYSPIEYYGHRDYKNSLRLFSKDFYSKEKTIHHYLHMAQGNYREYLQGDTVWLKKYLYVLRPLLAINFIEKTGGVPPVDFNVLVENTVNDMELLIDINDLLVAKKAGVELGMGNKIPSISNFMNKELDRLKDWNVQGIKNEDSSALDRFFKIVVMTNS